VSILSSIGLKTARQNFTYTSSGETQSGENVYAILQAPRGDATEAIVLIAARHNVRGERNTNGVALALTLSRYFRRWSLWSKDIIVLFPPESRAGPQAWADAYHDAHDAKAVASLPRKSGALQGAVALDFAKEGRFESVHAVYDGVNGMLPNLDLINSVVNIAGGQMGIGVAIQEMWRHDDSYRDRLRTMLRGMLKQGLGVASGPHSAFMAYHVDAVTLQPFGDGWQDEMAMGRVVEGTFRSLNNLLEHLHQSFFFYLLIGRERFVSIGTYLPSAMLVAANFTIMAIALWVESGQGLATAKGKNGNTAPSQAAERDLFLPLGVVAACQFLGAAPLYLFNHLPAPVSSDERTDDEVEMSMKLTRRPKAPRTRVPWFHRIQRSAATPPVVLPDALLPPHHAAVPAYEILLAATARNVPLVARDPQLLAVLPRRSARKPADLHGAAQSGRQQRRALVSDGCSESCRTDRRRPRGLARLGSQPRRRPADGRLRLGRVGHVHGRRRMVRLVAGLAGQLDACAGKAGREAEDGIMRVGATSSVRKIPL
jgi:GPI-anchor transamidase subunit GAA1